VHGGIETFILSVYVTVAVVVSVPLAVKVPVTVLIKAPTKEAPMLKVAVPETVQLLVSVAVKVDVQDTLGQPLPPVLD
jgi:hypothetical protein